MVGAPTHAFSLIRASTRESAADQATGGPVSWGRGVRERLDALAPVDRAVGVIAFDTKAEVGWLSGSAAR